MDPTPTKSWLLEFRSSELFIVLVVCIAIFTDVFIYGMIVPIIPKALVERAGVPEQDAQSWVSILLAIYGGALLLGSPIFGYFADRCQTRRVPFVIGLLALVGSTALFMLSTSPAGFFIARALQGLSGAAVWVIGLALVVDTVSDDRVAETMGYTTMSMTWGSLFGPTLGGVMYEHLGFYGAFYVPIGIILLDIILRFVMVEKTTPQRWQASLPIYYHTAPNDSPLNGGGHSDERSPLLSQEPISQPSTSKSKKPQIFRLLSLCRLQVALLTTLAVSILMSAFETTLPLFVMQTFHWSSSGAGLIFLAISIPSLAGALLGKLVDKAGARMIGSVTFGLAGLVLVLLRLVQHDTNADRLVLIGLLAILGISVTAITLVAMTEVFQAVYCPQARQSGTFGDASPIAQAYALFNMAYAGGQLLGPILGGFVKAHAGWETMTLVLGLVSCVVGIIVGVFGGAGRDSDEGVSW